MTISWFGHSCFRIEAKEGSILIDPFSKDIGLKPPRIKPARPDGRLGGDDLVLVSHDHYDHNNVEGASPQTMIINGPGEYEKNGINVRGVSSFHDNSQGKERGLNTIYIIKAEDITICHLGDLGQDKLEDTQVQDIGDVDILMIPVGGKYTLDFKGARQVVDQVEPKIIIPMHYKVKDLNLDIDGPDKFIKEIGLTPEKTDKLKVSAKTLPAEEIKLVVFNF